MQPNKRNKIIGFCIKTTIVILAILFIYKKVFDKEHLEDYIASYRLIITNGQSLPILLVVVILMLFNWSLESWKWKMMIQKIETISFLKAIEAVCTGITVSFFTPNRVCEFAGRVFYLTKADRIKASLIAVIGSFGQTIVTIVFGGIASLIYCREILKLDTFLFYGIASIATVVMALLILFYFNTPMLTILSDRVSFLKRFHKYTEVFTYFSTKELLKVFVLCVLRFLVFTTQYYLLFILADVHLSYIEGFMMIAMVFFTVTVVPTIALTEIGVRSASATYFIGMISSNHFGILFASFTLWFINLVIPSVFGAIFVFNFRLFRTK